MWAIYRADLRRARRSLIAVVVTFGLIVIPSLFTWFNVAASWDPFGNTRSLRIAIANTDVGFKSDLVPLHINIGDQVVSALRKNDNFDWVIATEDEAIDQVGRVGADLVSQLVHDGMSVGISWGRTMSAVASYLTRSPRQGVCVVQLKGGTSFSARATHDFEVMRAFCTAFTAQPRYLPLPVIFQSTKTASIVCKDQAIMKILEEGRNVDVAVFTIGAISNEVISLNLGHLGEKEVDTLLHRAVGDALSHFFTESGQVAIPELEARTVSISLEHLRTRPVRLVVAGGNVKMRALDTALRMGIATHLVVDQDLAAALLDMRERDAMTEVGDGARDVEHLSI